MNNDDGAAAEDQRAMFGPMVNASHHFRSRGVQAHMLFDFMCIVLQARRLSPSLPITGIAHYTTARPRLTLALGGQRTFAFNKGSNLKLEAHAKSELPVHLCTSASSGLTVSIRVVEVPA